METLKNRYIKVEHGTLEAEYAIKKLEELGYKNNQQSKCVSEKDPSINKIRILDTGYWWSNMDCASIDDWSELTLNDLFAMKKEEGFEKGKIYKVESCDNNGVVYCAKDSDELQGYAVYCDVWHDMQSWTGQIKEATTKEWEKALIKEAKRRGFEKGDVAFTSVHPNYTRWSKNSHVHIDSEFQYNLDEDSLKIWGHTCYYQGKWAKIIDDKIVINGYTAEDKGDYWKIGCARLEKSWIKDLLHLAECNDTNWESANRKIKSITLDSDITISIVALKQLHENI